jgi:hypothetical protein
VNKAKIALGEYLNGRLPDELSDAMNGLKTDP